MRASRHPRTRKMSPTMTSTTTTMATERADEERLAVGGRLLLRGSTRAPRPGLVGLVEEGHAAGLQPAPGRNESGQYDHRGGRLRPWAGRGSGLARRTEPRGGRRDQRPAHACRARPRARALPGGRAARGGRLRRRVARVGRAAGARGGAQGDPRRAGRRRRSPGSSARRAPPPGSPTPGSSRSTSSDATSAPCTSCSSSCAATVSPSCWGEGVVSDRDLARIGAVLCEALAHAHAPRRDPPRRQAAQRDRGRRARGGRGVGEAHRLRRRPPRRRREPDRHRGGARHARLHGARAGRGAGGHGSRRRLRARADPLRGLDGREPAAARGTARMGAARRTGRCRACGPLRRDLPPALGRAIDAALDPRPERRPSPAELGAALRGRRARPRRRRRARGGHDGPGPAAGPARGRRAGAGAGDAGRRPAGARPGAGASGRALGRGQILRSNPVFDEVGPARPPTIHRVARWERRQATGAEPRRPRARTPTRVDDDAAAPVR